MTIPTVTPGSVIDTTWGNAVAAELNASTEWTTWTPVLAQGISTNITKTVTYSKYVRSGPTGKTITWNFNVSATAPGTAGSSVTLTLPVTAAAGLQSGAAQVFDLSTSTRYSACLESSTTLVAFVGDWSGTSAWGAAPSIAVASGDVFRGSITYEAA